MPIQCANVVVGNGNLFDTISKMLAILPASLLAQFNGEKQNANMILYDYTHITAGNWAGIGADPNGQFIIYFGLNDNDRHSYVFTRDGIYLDNRKITT